MVMPFAAQQSELAQERIEGNLPILAIYLIMVVILEGGQGRPRKAFAVTVTLVSRREAWKLCFLVDLAALLFYCTGDLCFQWRTSKL
jgi:hypothetical protein